MTQRILIMGLPGAGKTTLAEQVVDKLQQRGATVAWLNADQVREQWNDWDFSTEGRIRQSVRMREIADASTSDYVVCDFVCPLPEMRNNFQAHWRIWVDTIREGRFEDTNAMFVPPTVWDFRIDTQDAERHSDSIVTAILSRQP
jgi:adenylylsulfate kinase